MTTASSLMIFFFCCITCRYSSFLLANLSETLSFISAVFDSCLVSSSSLFLCDFLFAFILFYTSPTNASIFFVSCKRLLNSCMQLLNFHITLMCCFSPPYHTCLCCVSFVVTRLNHRPTRSSSTPYWYFTLGNTFDFFELLLSFFSSKRITW